MDVRKWGFARQFTLAMAVVIASAVLTGSIAVVQLHSVSESKDRVTGVYAENAISAAKLENSVERRSASAREYLLTGDERALRRAQAEQRLFDTTLPDLRARALDAGGRALLERIDAAERTYTGALSHALALRREEADHAAVLRVFEDDVAPAKIELVRLLDGLEARRQQQLTDAVRTSSTSVTRAVVLVVSVAVLAFLVVVVLAVLLGRATRELVRRKEQVERANRDLDAFAGRAAHDLRNALGPVLLAPTLLRKGELSAERVDAVCRRLDRAIERAVGLIDALLAFSRSGAAPDTGAAASLRRVVMDVLEELEPRIAQTDAKVEVEVDDVEVRCPPGLLHVLVANLVGNAAKFVQDRPTREVRVRGSISRGGYELRVDDTGPGIPEDARARIFEPFYRVPGTKVSGTGIGLATVRRIVDAYGGRVTVESTVGEGSSFRAWLPMAEATPASVLAPGERAGAVHH